MKDTITYSPAGQLLRALLAIVAWFALGVQFIIIIRANAPGMAGLFISLDSFFSFFTILTNLLLAIGCTLPLIWRESPAGKFFNRAGVQTALTLYIIVVGIVYNLVLRQLWNPQGWQKIADMLLHDITPLAALLLWFLLVPAGLLGWKDCLPWLAYPGAYLAFALIRGAITGRYPYPFIDAGELGTARLLANIAGLLVGFILLGLVLIGINRLRGRLPGAKD